MSSVVTKRAVQRLKNIHQLSKKCNGPSKKKHLEKLLALVEKHVDEIRFLYKKDDLHYLVETGDLLILCFEILMENKRDIHKMTELCFGRYENKLDQLIERR